jgi:ribosomal protein L13
MKTYSLKKEEVERSWFVLDVSDRVLGRIATKLLIESEEKINQHLLHILMAETM